MVERLHRQLKAAIKCHQDNRRTEVLSTILPGIRAAWREDLQATAVELVYGEPLRLPGEFLIKRFSEDRDDAANYFKELRQHFRAMRPVNGTHHGDRRIFVFKDLMTSKHVFVSHGAPGGTVQQPYDGPFKVISRNNRTFVVNIRGKHVTVSIERLKPSYVISGDSDNAEEHGTDRVVQPGEEKDDPVEASGAPPTPAPQRPATIPTSTPFERADEPVSLIIFKSVFRDWLNHWPGGLWWRCLYYALATFKQLTFIFISFQTFTSSTSFLTVQFSLSIHSFDFRSNFLFTKTNNRLIVFLAIKSRPKLNLRGDKPGGREGPPARLRFLSNCL